MRIGGGPNTVQQYLRAGLIDEMHVAISPVLLGGGERLFEAVDLRALDTNASSSLRRKKPPMLCSGARAQRRLTTGCSARRCIDTVVLALGQWCAPLSAVTVMRLKTAR